MKLLKTAVKSFFIIFIIITVFIICINIYMINYSRDYIKKNIYDLNKSQAVIILGARVYKDGRISSILYDRVITAIDIYNAKKADIIFISADGSDCITNEVDVVRKYLLKNNIKNENIISDSEGFNTYDSMRRAKTIFNLSRCIIVTQKYHLSRSVWTASKLGLNAEGYPSDKQSYLKINFFKTRERLSRIKSFFIWYINHSSSNKK